MAIQEKESVFYLIDENKRFICFDTFKSMVEYSESGVKIKVRNWKDHITYSKNTHGQYVITIFNSKGEKTTYTRNNWTLKDIQAGEFKYYDGSYYSANVVVYVDPLGIQKHVRFSMYFDDLENPTHLMRVFEYFYEISNYESWQNYSLSVENDKLKERVTNLEQAIAELKEKVDASGH